MTDYAFLFELERELHTSATRSNEQRLSALLSPRFFEYGASGTIWSRQQILERLPTESPTTISSTQYQATELSPTVVLVTYLSEREDSKFLGSSIWRRNPPGWQLEFHQGTPTSK